MISYCDWRKTESFELEQAAFDQLNKLFYELYEARLQPVGETSHQKYALFHYIERAEHLLRVIGAILRRMASDQNSYQRVFENEQAHLFSSFEQGRSIVVGADQSSERYREFLIADFESLYQVGHTLLDEWALIIGHIAALPQPNSINFNRMVTTHLATPENGLLADIKRKSADSIDWLYSHILIFRDKFIVHQTRPFQLSTITNSATGDLRLSYLVSSVWYGEAETGKLHEEIWELNSQVREDVRLNRESITNPNYVLAHLFEHLDAFGANQRDELQRLAKENGFTTPSSSLLAHRLFDFIATSILIVREYSTDSYASIKLGERSR